MYYGWFDDSSKTPTELKIQDAVEAYVRRFGKRPNTVLVNEADVIEMQGLQIRPEGFIRRNNFWVGWESNGQAALPIAAPTATPTEAPQPAKRSTRKHAKLAA